MNALTRFAADWLPPAVIRASRRWRESGIRFDGEFETWQQAAARCTGYEASQILDKVLDATLKVKRGEAAYERDSVLFEETDYNWPVATGLLWTAARCQGRLAVLDYGGALGSSYFQNRGVFTGLPEVSWSVVEQANYVVAGRAHVQGETLRFYETIAACVSEQTPNVVLLSSVLQYLENPYALLEQVELIDADVIIIDRTIVNAGARDRIYVQTVPPSIYSATYPCRSLSQRGLVAGLESRYRLVSSFPSLEFPALEAIESEFKGFLFEKARP